MGVISFSSLYEIKIFDKTSLGSKDQSTCNLNVNALKSVWISPIPRVLPLGGWRPRIGALAITSIGLFKYSGLIRECMVTPTR